MFKTFPKIVFILFVLLFLNLNLAAQSNLDFENALIHWTLKGIAFQNQPENGNTVRTYRVRPEISDSIGGDYWRGIPHSIGHHGNSWVTSYKINKDDSISSYDSLGNLPTGSLTSEEFTITSDTIYFLLGGNGGKVELWIKEEEILDEVLDNNKSSLFNYYHVVDSKFPSNETEVMGREYFYTSNLKNKNAVIRIIDSSVTEHINVDDFYINEIYSDEIIEYNFRTSYDIDSNNYKKIKYFKKRDNNLPLWGFIDTHGHWMNNEAFGVDLVFGKPYGNIDTALKRCAGFINFDKHNGKKLIFNEFHKGVEYSGYPDFKSWPRFNDILHQSMYVDWVKRAYLGGLRLIVCPMGNNSNLPKIMGSIYDTELNSDTATVRREVEYLNNMINILKNEGWIDIAESSDQAKKLILENKLVIIKGMEVDQLGGFLYLDSTKKETNKKEIEDYLNYIHDELGILHMFPIHHCDNAFGGFSLYGTEFFSINNYHLKKFDTRISKKDKYVQLESSSLTSFRLGNEKGFKFKAVTLGNLPIGNVFSNGFYNPPGSRKSIIFTGESNYTDFAIGKGHINIKGLSTSGKLLIELMMNKGMVIDIDHMSMKSTNDVLNILENIFVISDNDTLFYPVISGHSNFLEQQLSSNETSDCENCLLKLKNEQAKSVNMLIKMKKLGGMVSPITEGEKDVSSKMFAKNENPGSSKTWAESYVFALNNFGFKNIGFGTDMNGLVTQISPRFGTSSSYSLRDDCIRMKELGNRRYLSYLQNNGVNYVTNLKDCKEEKFEGKGVFSEEQSFIWQSIYAAHSPYGSNLILKYNNILEGFKLGIDSIIISKLNIETYDLNEAKIAAYIVSLKYEHNIVVNRKLFYKIYNARSIKKWEQKIEPIYWNFSRTKGNNIPLLRCEIQTNNRGVKDFDFNIDGLAHYGLFPDFIQDLKNIGLSYDQLSVLFNSAGDFTKLLERCEIFSEKYSKSK